MTKKYKSYEALEAQRWAENIYDVSYIGGLIKNSDNVLALEKLRDMIDMSITSEICRIILEKSNNSNTEE